MWTLGLSGGLDRIDEHTLALGGYGHDAAAVLLHDEEVVAGIELERLDRIKHSDKLAKAAIDFCLEQAGITIGQVDQIACAIEEVGADAFLLGRYVGAALPRLVSTRRLLVERLGYAELDPARFVFVEHHLAHATSAYAMSGFEDALVITADGAGSDGNCATVYEGHAGKLRRVREHKLPHSLGRFYTSVIEYLGYGLFDEYKVMGLAPFGDGRRFRSLFDSLYDLTPDGWFRVKGDLASNGPALWTLMMAHGCGKPRRRGEEFNQDHRDLAAALQDLVEKVLFHFFRHNRAESGLGSLCFAGGVAHNVTFNGKLLQSGLFEKQFIQPASHDAGNAIGAAIHAHRSKNVAPAPRRIAHVYWGTPLPKDDELSALLGSWDQFIITRHEADIVQVAVDLLDAGKVLGWVQGRSEFGPRALGNRSIIADPRPAENKSRINAMIKKREAYRPFAPSVPEERAAEFYELGTGARHDFMLYSVATKPALRDVLGAVTHVDGSARVQTVSRAANPRYWELLQRFGDRTGVPVLLNTSFNNDAEPIVDSVEDAVVCFLTTELDHLVVGDHLVSRRGPLSAEALLDLSMTLHRCRELQRTSKPNRPDEVRITSSYARHGSVPVSSALGALLAKADGAGRIIDSLSGTTTAERASLIVEIRALWEKRVIRLAPARRSVPA